MGSDEIIKNMYDLSDDIDEEDSSSRSGLEKETFKKETFLMFQITISYSIYLEKSCLKH